MRPLQKVLVGAQTTVWARRRHPALPLFYTQEVFLKQSTSCSLPRVCLFLQCRLWLQVEVILRSVLNMKHVLIFDFTWCTKLCNNWRYYNFVVYFVWFNLTAVTLSLLFLTESELFFKGKSVLNYIQHQEKKKAKSIIKLTRKLCQCVANELV